MMKFWFTIFAFIVACGKPTAKKQPVSFLEPVSFYNPTDAFYLTTANSQASYDGSLTIFHNDADLDHLQKVVSSTREYRLAAADRKSGLRQVLPLRQNLKDLKTQINQITENSKSDPQTVEYRIKEAGQWFHKTLDRIAETGQDMSTVKQLFFRYCEAKLWQLALKKEFVQYDSKYLSKPTPLQFCEGYFSEQNLLSSAEDSCSSKENNHAGRDYYSCYWQQGVFKSKFFTDEYSPSKQQLITSVYENQQFRAGLIESSNLRRAIITQKEMRVSSVKSLIGEEQYDRLSAEQRQQYLALFVPDQKKAPVDETPERIIECFEEPETFACPDHLVLVPRAAGSEQAKKMLERLMQNFKDFAFTSSDRPTVNDYFYNHPVNKNQDSKPERLEAVLDNPDFYFFNEVAPKFKEQLKQLTAQETRLQVELGEKEQVLEQYSQRALKHLIEGGQAISAPGVAKVLLLGQLTLQRDQNRLVVKYKIFNAKDLTVLPVLGCWDLEKNDQTSCDQDNNVDNPAVLKVEQEKGKIIIEQSLANLTQIGLQHLGRGVSGTNFNEFPDQELQTYRLRLELYQNIVKDILLIISGKAELIKDDQTIYQGGVSLIESSS